MKSSHHRFKSKELMVPFGRWSAASRAFSYHISRKDAEEKARAWANVVMVSCVADPHEIEAKCATNKPQESNWYLSEIGLLRA